MAEESLTIAEANKIRLSLGLKPLRDTEPKPADQDSKADAADDNTAEAQEKKAVDNWKKHHAQVDTEAAKKAKRDRLKKELDAERRFAVLEGKGLGDEDENEVDTTTWVKKSAKRQRKIAERMAKEKEEELERLANETREYKAEDLAGVRVGHDLDDLEGENGTILTLKDTTIDENEAEGDELISTDLAERERLDERLTLKKKKPVYNAYEEENGTGEKRILAQYDEEIDGKKKKRFVLNGTGSSAGTEAYRQEVAEKLKSKPVSLDMIKTEAASDYLDPSKMKIRKPKKSKKSKSTRKRSEDDGDALNPQASNDATPDESNFMEVDTSGGVPVAPKPKRTYEDISFVDDDDLQASLALSRRTALKKRKILKPSDLARQFREESAAGTPGGIDTPGGAMEEDEEEPGLVIDETSEFVATLRAPVIPERRKSSSEPAKPTGITSMADSPESGDHDTDMDRDFGPDAIKHEFESATTITTQAPEISSTGLEEETTITKGVGATLAMLNQRGLLKRDVDADKKLQLQRDREKFRTQKRLREIEAEEKAKAQRARDRSSGKFDRMSAREREEHARWENRQRDLAEAREMATRFKDYRPDVELSYKDEFGREMSQKEAFKHLSHQFHGKGSGKAKTEKRLKKIEDEKKREAASSLNASNENHAVQTAAKKSKQAGVRLM